MRVSRYATAEITNGGSSPLLAGYFFASPEFAAVWKSKGGRPVTWVAEEAGEPLAILPGVEFGRAPLCRFMSMADGCYGGVFFSPAQALDRRRIVRSLIGAVARRGYLDVHLYDFYGTIIDPAPLRSFPCTTRLIDIDGEQWSPPDPKLLSQIRKAEREGIQVEPFDWDRHHTKFLELVKRCESQHGRRPKYRPRFYEALARLAAEDDRIEWLWCERDGRAATSHIYFVEHGMLQAWQTYFDRTFSFLKPNQYIRFQLCRKMAAAGITRMNLGATPPGASGLDYYKARWGGRTFAYQAFVLDSGLGRILMSARGA